MTLAKHLHAQQKPVAIRASFEKKLVDMELTLEIWRKRGAQDGRFWPKSLSALAAWDDPQNGIHKLRSKTITIPGGSYGDLVRRYWEIQEKSKSIISKKSDYEKLMLLKAENSVLIIQNTKLVWSVTELRDALIRIDPTNEALTRLEFP